MIEVKTSSLERKIKSKIPPSLKEAALVVLTNPLCGKMIKLFGLRHNLYGGVFEYSSVSDREAASIFWGVWESAEIRFSKKFANSKTIVELGSSVGVTLGVLANNRKETKFVCVEASQVNFSKLTSLRNYLPGNQNSYLILNKAIAYGVRSIGFPHVTTLGSKIDESVKNDNIVSAISLSELLLEKDIDGAFTLITDIEGAEASIFFNDSEALTHCETIIAELEDVKQWSIEDQIKQLEYLGFNLNERYGNVVAMNRK